MKDPFENFEHRSKEQLLIRSFLEISKGLERELRYGNQNRTEEEMAELRQSVAEHMQGMHWLADFILSEDEEAVELNREKIGRLINRHDMHEALTGDQLVKDEETLLKERAAEAKLVEAAGTVGISPDLEEMLGEYVNRETAEAKFVKGLDRLEAYLTMIYAGRADMFTENHSHNEHEIAESIRDISPMLHKSLDLTVRLLRLKKRGNEEQFELDV